MYRYDTCIRYDMYPIRRYIYLQNNRIRYVIYEYWKLYNNSYKHNKYMIANVWIQISWLETNYFGSQNLVANVSD